ncbi:MAG: serine hydrolase [Candidatus Sumerlaeia bacterium]|nr:serine hydrolase [Candidatus Sumerlaeia bacterium]
MRGLMIGLLLLGVVGCARTASSPVPIPDGSPAVIPDAAAVADTMEARVLAAVRAFEEAHSCKVGLAFKDKATGESISHRGDELFHPASTMKVAVMVGAFQQADEGLFALGDQVEVRDTFSSMIDGSPFKTAPARPLREHLGGKVSVRFLIEEMIQISDNAATNILIEMCGPKRITAAMRGLGARKSYVIRPLEDEEAFQAGISNRFTPDDLTRLMEAIDQDQAASPAACAEMRAILKGQRYRNLIPAGVPEGVEVGNKTGSITAHRHDTGIVYAPFGTYYLTVLVAGVADGEAGNRIVVELSRMIYEECMRRSS